MRVGVDSAWRAIPGPEGGGPADIAAAGGLHNYQLTLHDEYGPVVRFVLPGTARAVSIADPVLLEPVARIDARPQRLFEFLAPLQESGNLQTMTAAEHAPWRRVLLSVLAGRQSHEAHFKQFVALTRELADRWAAAGGPIGLQHDLSALSLRMICAYALGSDWRSERAARVVAAFQEVLGEYLGRLYEPDGGDEARAEAALAYLRATVDEVLAAHATEAPESVDRSDLIAALAAAGQPAARIRDTVLMTMLAAHHTTGVAVSWTLYLLARHPAIADRVAEEVRAVLRDRDAPAYGDLKRLRYLRMVLQETMRLYPPGPYGAREATEDMTIGGHPIPVGTTIFLPFRAVHMNPEYWPAPAEFDPERFAPERIAERHRFAYLPFGLGPRGCEGAALAMVEAQLVLAMLIRRFRFELVAGHEVTPVERFVLWAAEDIRVHLRPRG
ncbi:cytochrome P450 [Nocardia sp. CDC159]|uniref:Cytochrome P450 n=1 Tax=Nocardia pulmonis TaxID=2951408 RepID=A0A9X2IY07_9NOCA|nr:MULTISPECIES: cytochrome P450 [Nocardia]MCM6773396.1 cytochrome P450 [Nocardia pulmonis]MCM6786283.1 cytochrome P450 [Nocardia sp. CDC159]